MDFLSAILDHPLFTAWSIAFVLWYLIPILLNIFVFSRREREHWRKHVRESYPTKYDE